MDPQTLIDRTLSEGLPGLAGGLPAPYWFVQLFKVLGFTLHMVPMNLWFAGLLLAVWLHWRGGEHGKRFGARLMAQMPILVAFGINLGIVPLLFLQLAYAKVFYPATILMAWFWLAIVVLLIPAYYGVYVYAFGLRGQMAGWKRAAGWLSAGLFVAIGFLFANGLSLMTNVGGWEGWWARTNVAGAPVGIALNLFDPTLWPRWLLMFGLALGTTAAWCAIDATWLPEPEKGTGLICRNGPEGAPHKLDLSPFPVGYRAWAGRFSLQLMTVGALWVVVVGAWYLFGTWPSAVRSQMFSGLWIVLTGLTALAPGLPWLLLFLGRNEPLSRGRAAAVGLAQLGVLAVNAVSRQVVQNLELKPYLDVAAVPVAPDWGAMALFLGTFVLGAGMVAWMLVQVRLSARGSQEG